MKLEFEPIGVVKTTREDTEGDRWGGVESQILLDERFGPEALAGLEEFSHVEVLFFFDRVDPSRIVKGLRSPRDNPKWPAVGIFSQRGRNRPNRIGSTIARLLGREGRRLHLAELDAIDGSPVLDIKPVMQEFLPRSEVRQPTWASEVMRAYWSRGDGRIGASLAPQTTITHSGGCHCGRVRFEVDAPAEIEVHECNCSICSKLGYLHLTVPRSRFRLLSGREHLSSYRFNTGVAEHLFCSVCGVKSFYIPRSHPDGYSVNARALDPGTVRHQVVRLFDGASWEAHAAELPALTAPLVPR